MRLLKANSRSFPVNFQAILSITPATMGGGCAKRFGALKLSLVVRILWTRVLTLPAAGGVASLLVHGFRLCGWIP